MNTATENTRVMRFAQSLVQTTVLSLLTWILGPTPAAGQGAGNLPPGPPIVYVGNGGGGVTEINTANNSVIATAPFPNNANGVVVTPDGSRMYATNRDVGQVTVFSTCDSPRHRDGLASKQRGYRRDCALAWSRKHRDHQCLLCMRTSP